MTKSSTMSVTREAKLDFLFAAPNVRFPLTCEAYLESCRNILLQQVYSSTFNTQLNLSVSH